MTATIADVAKLAGVSNGTVSKVLKNYTNVSTKTREKVLQAIKELNYVPNSIASALSSKQYNKIALYIYINDQHQAIDEINMQYLQGAFKAAQALDLNAVTVFSETVSKFNTQELIQYFISQGIRGIVVYGLNKDDKIIHEIIDKELFKIVTIDALPIFNSSTSAVAVDHEAGQYAVAKKTIEKEYCHKVLYIAGKQNGYVTDQRISGINNLKAEYQFEMKLVYGDFSEKKAFNIVKHYGDWADTIVCASDLMAIGAVNALIQMNIFRRVCGYDGISLMGYAGHQMLTCKQDFKETSKVAIEEMWRLIQGGEGKQIKLPYKVVSIKYEDVIN